MKSRLTVQLMGHVSFLIDDKPIKQLNLTTAQAVVILVLLADAPLSREWLTNTVIYSTDPEQASAN
ncbi:MAG TPA: hypothetical protein ENJ56_04745, partial [Anaerolineae bacterium]|nr:hypothetical protein [Anaerolineae bacterium]